MYSNQRLNKRVPYTMATELPRYRGELGRSQLWRRLRECPRAASQCEVDMLHLSSICSDPILGCCVGNSLVFLGGGVGGGVGRGVV